ncbi:hypothetical protein CSUI_005886, partial [Cystoisospora suis]
MRSDIYGVLTSRLKRFTGVMRNDLGCSFQRVCRLGSRGIGPNFPTQGDVFGSRPDLGTSPPEWELGFPSFGNASGSWCYHRT